MSDAEEPIPAEARGYARAVAALRDDEGYRHWWSADGAWQHKPTGRYWDADARGHLADYLETINQPLPRGDDTMNTHRRDDMSELRAELRAEITAYADLLARSSGAVPSVDVAWKLRQILADPNAGVPDAPVVHSAPVRMRVTEVQLATRRPTLANLTAWAHALGYELALIPIKEETTP